MYCRGRTTKRRHPEGSASSAAGLPDHLGERTAFEERHVDGPDHVGGEPAGSREEHQQSDDREDPERARVSDAGRGC